MNAWAANMQLSAHFTRISSSTRSLRAATLSKNSGFLWERGPLARTFADAGGTPALPGIASVLTASS